MKLVATKLEMDTVETMSRLVIENVDAIASDLTVLDSRLLLGNANIDVVALDGNGSLVLIAIDRTSDEQLLLKAVEAYSWCLEYPEAMRRLYPAADVSMERPPRVMFVVERMSDAFHRKVKQLGFPEVDCVEFRHLTIDGAEAVHFDTVVRLRRPSLVATPAPVAAPAPDNAAHDAGPVGRATSVKLRKLLTTDAPGPSASRPVERPTAQRPAASTPVSAPSPAREPGVVVSMMNRAGRHAAARLDETTLPAAPTPTIAPAATQTLLPPTPRSLHAEPTAAPMGTITLEPAAIVPVVPEVIVEPAPVVAPAVVAVAPVLELVPAPEPVVAVMPVLELMVEPPPIVTPEPVVVVAPVLELMMEPASVAPEPIVAIAPALELMMERASVAPEPIVAIAPALMVEPDPIAAPEPVIAVAPVLELMTEPVSVAPEPVVAIAPVLVMEPEPIAATPVFELVVDPEPIATPKPIVAAPAPVAAAPEPPRISFSDLSKQLLASQSAERKPVMPSKPVAPTRPVEPAVSIKPAAVAGGAEKLSFADLSKDLLGAAAPVRVTQKNGPTPMRLQVATAVERPEAEIVAPAGGAAPVPSLTLDALVDAAAQAVAEPAAEGTDPSAMPDMPEEFAGLKFPGGDGVLTRQWMDFLNQMTATK